MGCECGVCFLCNKSPGRCGKPAVRGVCGLDVVIRGDRDSGKGREEELKRGSNGFKSRRDGRGLGSKGCLLVGVAEGDRLVPDDEQTLLARLDISPFIGALPVLVVSFNLLVLVEPGVVV